MYTTWGREGIDDNTMAQMDVACRLPVAVGGALMPDAHLGYGLPIGGVLALDNAVCPYAVGVDIACRMKLSIFDIPASACSLEWKELSCILERETFFGVGVSNSRRDRHPVMEENWGISPMTSANKQRAFDQLGTSGSGNHFVEFGSFVGYDAEMPSGPYLALMSHSGSRGVGAAVCDFYSKLAKELHPEGGDLAWLDLDSKEGQEYWAAMELMGKYSSANHDCIHRAISKALGQGPIAVIENHHNFAWKERHAGLDLIVHRKGATPAGHGVFGVIPGSMGTPAYVVRGKGSVESLCSASHGAGRLMSRSQAKKTFDYKTEIEKLANRGVTVLSAGADELVGAYKDIDKVMKAQEDLVEAVGTFMPRIVKMSK